MSLADKVAVITGSGRGIGGEMARIFAAEGASVVVADIDSGAAEGTAAHIAESGGVSLALRTDVSDPGEVDEMVAQTVARFGRLDILVNNAGIGLNKPFLETTLDEWERMLSVVLTGTFLCAQAAARVMVRQGRGRIVNVGSISGQRGAQGRAAYGAAKAGVIQLTRTLAVELAPLGVGVNPVSPGPVDTEQSRSTHTQATRDAYLSRIPVGRYGDRHEIVAAVRFLASDESSFVSGHILNVDGGFNAAGLVFDPEAE